MPEEQKPPFNRTAFDPSRRDRGEQLVQGALAKHGMPPFQIRMELEAMKVGILHHFDGMEDNFKEAAAQALDAAIDNFPFQKKIEEILLQELGQAMQRTMQSALYELFGYNGELAAKLKESTKATILAHFKKEADAEDNDRSGNRKG